MIQNIAHNTSLIVRAKPGFVLPSRYSSRKSFRALGTLLLLCLLLSLESCLNYPARINYGLELQDKQAHTKEKNRELAQSQQRTPFDPSETLISSQLVVELSHNQLQALDENDIYGELRRYPLQVYRITYRSKNFSPLSALVLLPVGMDIEEYHVLAYHHGTLLPFPFKHLGAYEAPSLFGSRYRKMKDFFAVNRYGLPAASSGYLTVMPDYMGYGVQAGEEHPFMIGPELGREAMDALSAVYQWAREKGLQTSSRLYLSGTSEGACAAIWAQRLIESSPNFQDLQVEGAYYAGPYYMSSLLKKIAFDDSKINPLFNWAVYSCWDYFLRDAQVRQQHLAQYFQPEQYSQLSGTQSWQKSDIWQRKVPNILSILLQKSLPKEELFQPSFLGQVNDLDSDFWILAKLLDIQSGWRPVGPIHLYHNSGDPLVPPQHSEDVASELQAAGGQVALEMFERKDHAGGHLPYLLKSLGVFSQSSGLYAPPYSEEQP